MVDREHIERAATRLRGRIRRTPVFHAAGGGYADDEVIFKLEMLQHTGTFKARGALNRVLAAAESDELPESGVVAASGGNAGMAAAYAAAQVGVPAEVFVPVTASPVKVARLRAYGATVVQHGQEYAEAYEAAVKRAADSGALFVHAYDQPEIVAGQGTLGLELLDDADVDTVLVACGGGGLMAGVAAAAEGRARVVAVEPFTAPTLAAALAAGGPVDVEVSGVAADALGARRLGAIAYQVAVRTDVLSVLVDDADLIAARRELWQRYRLLVEHGAAAAYAALHSAAYRPEPGERVAVVLCGANTDPTTL